MLILSLGLNLTQTEMAVVLKNKYPEIQKQYQVARQLARHNKILLKEFISESKKIYPEICLNEEKDIEIIKHSLEECLQIHCQQLCKYVLDKITKEWQVKSQINILQLELIDKEKTDKNIGGSILKVSPNRNEVNNILKEAFMYQLEIDMGLPTDLLALVSNKLADFVDEWLKDNLKKLGIRN